jgi:hypothetical protein
MPKLNTVGFTPPPDFPVEAYNKVHQYLNKYKDTHKVQWSLFSSGWNGLAYRYRAMAEYDERFTTSVKEFGNSPPPEERYEQGKALFGFFTNAVSVIDCFFFSIYCIASILQPNVFPVSQSGDLEFTPTDFARRFDTKFQNYSLSVATQQCLRDSTYWKINDIRRVLIHRGMPPRKFYQGGERHGMATMPTNLPAPSDQWQFDFPVDEQTTKMFREWLSNTLVGLMDSADKFCAIKLKA